MSKSAARPNGIVFFTDQQRFDSTGVHGNPLELTPNFDRLAAEGTHLFNSFTCQPVCGPARSCLQTGHYATTTACWRNGIALRPDQPTLAHYFNAAGYHTGYIGKWHLADQNPVPAAQRGGYRYWLASNVLEFTSDAYQTRMFDGRGRPVDLPGYRVDALTDAAIRFIDENRKFPFFLFVSFVEPHFQNHLDNYPAPEGYEPRYAGRWMPPDLAELGGTSARHLGGYWGMIKRLDEALGRLCDALKSLDLLEQTILLVTSDHGCHFKTRNSEYKRSCHESSIRIPTALYGGPFTGGGRVRELVSLPDLPPTLLAAAGIPVPAHMQGQSVLPLIARRRVTWPREVFVQISEDHTGRAIRTERWKYAVVAADQNAAQEVAGYRYGQSGSGRGRLQAAGADRYVEAYLYDLHADPYELVNLAGLENYRAVADDLRRRLIRRMVHAGEKAPRIDKAPVRPAGQRHP